MKESYYLSKAQSDILHDIDRLIDWHKANGSSVPSLTLSKKQHVEIMKIAVRRKSRPVYHPEGGAVKITDTSYRGIKFELITIRQSRAKHTKRDLCPLEFGEA